MRVEAPIKVDRKTKRLAKRLTGREIAVINHMDIDEVAANSLVEGKVKLVINAAQSISGKYPNKGPGILTDKNILIIDNVGQELFDELKEGQIIEVNITPDSKLVNKSIADADISEDILILMIKRRGKTIVPKGITIIEDGDVLVVTGDNLEQISL